MRGRRGDVEEVEEESGVKRQVGTGSETGSESRDRT